MKFFLFLILFSCRPSNEDLFKKEAQEILKPFKVELMGALSSKMNEKGPIEAMHSCNILAPEIQKKLSVERITLGRTSHKIRNPINTPDDWMKPLLEEYKTSNADKPMEGKVIQEKEFIAYVEPIYIKEMCLTCHGKGIPDALTEGIQKYYPDDKATDFNLGEFRGLFWVKKDLK